MSKKKYPVIQPEYSKDKKVVYLDFNTYESILKEVSELESKIKDLKKASKKSSSKNK